MSHPSTHVEALQAGVVHYFTGKPCKRGHVSLRYVGNRGCVECLRSRNAEWMNADRSRNREQYLETERQSRTRARARLGLDGWKRRSKKYNLKKYGISVEHFEAMLDSQGNACAICRGPAGTIKGFHVDHDHKTGVVRGLLCHTCNQGMIAVDRVSEWFDKAAAYAARGKEK